MVHARRQAAITLVAAAVFAYFQHCAFVAGSPASLRPSSRETRRDVSCKNTAGLSGNRIMIKLPKATNFAIRDIKLERRETMQCRPRLPVQKLHFVRALQSGREISDVYVRFEGKTPWKKAGEITHTDGNFEEAVKCQYNLILDNAHLIHRKIRYFHHTDQIMQFGYTNKDAEIVQMDSGFYPFGTEPWEIARKLHKSGFRAALKAYEWRGMKTNIRAHVDSKKGFYQNKPWLLKRAEHLTLQFGHRWYNPDKAHQLGPSYMPGKAKRGIIQNSAVSGSMRRQTWKKKDKKRRLRKGKHT